MQRCYNVASNVLLCYDVAARYICVMKIATLLLHCSAATADVAAALQLRAVAHSPVHVLGACEHRRLMSGCMVAWRVLLEWRMLRVCVFYSIQYLLNS